MIYDIEMPKSCWTSKLLWCGWTLALSYTVYLYLNLKIMYCVVSCSFGICLTCGWSLSITILALLLYFFRMMWCLCGQTCQMLENFFMINTFYFNDTSITSSWTDNSLKSFKKFSAENFPVLKLTSSALQLISSLGLLS